MNTIKRACSINTGYSYEISEEQRRKNELKTSIQLLFKYRNSYYWNRTIAAINEILRPYLDRLLDWYCVRRYGMTYADLEYLHDLIEYARTDPKHKRYGDPRTSEQKDLDEFQAEVMATRSSDYPI